MYYNRSQQLKVIIEQNINSVFGAKQKIGVWLK